MYNLNKKNGYKKIFLIFMLSFMFVFSRFNNAFCISESIDNNTDSTTGTSMKSISATATNDDNVTIEITTDKDNYSLLDTANFTVKLTNKNTYSVFVCDLKFGDDLPDYIVEQIKAELPEKIDAATNKNTPEVETVEIDNIKIGFSSFKTVKVGDEEIQVGLVASPDVVPLDAEFNVESIDSSHSDYETHLKNLDDQSNMQRVTFFDLTLKKNNNEGSELITKFNGYVKVYIQVPNGWDAEELQALFVSTGKDEEFVETLETVDNVEYLTFTTSHFSPYALYDPEELAELGLTSDDINNSSNNDNDIDESYKTGHSDLKTILVLTGVAVVSLIIALMFSNKFRKTMLCLGIFFGLMGQALVNDSSISYAAESTTSNSNMNIKLEAIGKSGSYTEDVTVTLSFSVSSYQDKDSTKCWAVFDDSEEDAKADVFFVAPTVHDDTTKAVNMSINDLTARSAFTTVVKIQRGIYDNSTDDSTLDSYYASEEGADLKRRFFAPFYRQARFDTYFTTDDNEEYLKIAYSDVKDAFEYYLNNTNNEKPVILAGFSQGADMCVRLLKDFKDKLKGNLVACYAIGWRYTEDDAEKSGFSIASDEDGTGCVISFNCEDGKINDTVIVPKGTNNLCVNPLTWNGTTGTKQSSLSLFFDSSTGNVITDGMTGNKIEKLITGIEITDRKTLGLTFDNNELYETIVNKINEYTNGLASIKHEGSYHTYDYQFFYGNLKQNVVKRLKKFLETD